MDCCLLYTGAGWSAMSNLPTYENLRDAQYLDIFNAYNYGKRINKHPRRTVDMFAYIDAMKREYISAKPHPYYAWFDELADRNYSSNTLWNTLWEGYSSSFDLVHYVDSKLPTSDGLPRRFFSVTSNVDGLFYRSCIPNWEHYSFHGVLNDHQCLQGRHQLILRAKENQLIPTDSRCPLCNSFSRPNIKMFRDTKFLKREDELGRYNHWLDSARKYLKKTGGKLVIYDIGIGHTVPDLMSHMMRVYDSFQKEAISIKWIRINPDRNLYKPGRCEFIHADSMTTLNKLMITNCLTGSTSG